MIELKDKAIFDFKEPENAFYRIVQIGCGGTGSNIVQHVAQLLSLTERLYYDYTLIDPDVLEEKNLKNQLFLPEEVGQKKSDILAERYSIAFDLTISSYSDKYIESIEELKNFFSRVYCTTPTPWSSVFIPVIIGAVDNNATRKLLHQLFNELPNVIYIDAGNDAIDVPTNWQTRPKSNWTSNELELYNSTGWNGQVCMGLRFDGKTILEPVATQFHGILDDNDTIFPSETSCSELAASEPQRIFVNKMSAFIVSNMINELLNTFTITNHYSIFNAKSCFIRSCEANLTESF